MSLVRVWYGFITMIMLLAGAVASDAASITLSWQPSTGATSYRIYQSVDRGLTWTQVLETGTTSAVVVTPDTGLTLYRGSVLDETGESIRFEYGAWYNGDLLTAPPPTGLGIQ